MKDNTTTISHLKKITEQFITERDWQQFHTPKDICMDISVEAAELMELFLWCDTKATNEVMIEKRQQIEDEVADVAKALLYFCVHMNIDLTSAIEKKLISTAKKYPIEKAKGNYKKYTEL